MRLWAVVCRTRVGEYSPWQEGSEPGMLTLGRSAAIYAYDVAMRSDSPFLSNKRVFAVPISGVPTGVKCDEDGRVYAGCADGVEIWNAGGTLQAVVEIPGEWTPPRSTSNRLCCMLTCSQVVSQTYVSGDVMRSQGRCSSAPNKGYGDCDLEVTASSYCHSGSSDNRLGKQCKQETRGKIVFFLSRELQGSLTVSSTDA